MTSMVTRENLGERCGDEKEMRSQGSKYDPLSGEAHGVGESRQRFEVVVDEGRSMSSMVVQKNLGKGDRDAKGARELEVNIR